MTAGSSACSDQLPMSEDGGDMDVDVDQDEFGEDSEDDDPDEQASLAVEQFETLKEERIQTANERALKLRQTQALERMVRYLF